MNTTLTDTERTLAQWLEDGRAHEILRATFDHPEDGPMDVPIGTYVGSAMGHYTTSEAIGIARVGLGWAPDDVAELDYWLALYGRPGRFISGWTLDEHNAERARAGLGPVDDAGAEDAEMMAGEMLSYYLDDAETWLDERTSIDDSALVSALVDETGATEDDARSAIDDEGIGAYWSHDEGWGLNLCAESLVW